MARTAHHYPDEIANAAPIVGEATTVSSLHTADTESAWTMWPVPVQQVDERAMSLLQGAFEAGYESGRSSGS